MSAPLASALQEPVTVTSDIVVDDAALRLADLTARYGHLDGIELLRALLTEEMPGQIALVSSFGAESAVLLAMAAEVDPAVPVIFLDTGKLFGETITYRDKLVRALGLTNVQTFKPLPAAEAELDKPGTLWRDNPDACCAFRKVEPLDRALKPYAGWITGRKRFQSNSRAALPLIEIEDGKLKINPLANWDANSLRLSSSAAICHAIRWSPTVICRSAACPAPTRLPPARMRGPAVGRASRRRSAASTCRVFRPNARRVRPSICSSWKIRASIFCAKPSRGCPSWRCCGRSARTAMF